MKSIDNNGNYSTFSGSANIRYGSIMRYADAWPAVLRQRPSMTTTVYSTKRHGVEFRGLIS